MTAAVARMLGVCAVEPTAPRPPGPTDVVVRIEASGLCHSDLSAFAGSLPVPPPFVLGHEGAGVVEAIGPGVSRVTPGDRVVLAAIAPCGACTACGRGEPFLCQHSRRGDPSPCLDAAGEPLAGLSGLGTFCDALTVPEAATVPVRTDLPADQLALVGCAVVTGAGSVLNLAGVRPGDQVAVIGAGGIGLMAVQAARVAGAEPITVLDPSSAARDTALLLGATHAVDPAGPGALDAALAPAGGRARGYDAVLDCVGVTSTAALAWDLTRRGGVIVMVGIGPGDASFPVPLVQVPLSGKRIVGCVYGGVSVHRDIPRYVAWAESGRFDLGALIGRRITMDGVPDAFHHPSVAAGRTVMLNPT